jgi:DNA-binding CsgD family transcriptional regulator/tetratricopeptide (TPR) repeat protein
MLLERERERAALEGAVAEAREGGRVVLVVGEAGIGKTRLVEAVLTQQEGLRVLWGACDPLVVPRPLGPVLDVARHVGGPLAAALDGGGAREQLLAAMLDELAAKAPSALVVEDLHWVDEATLDLLALLGRRLTRSRGCLVLTCRDDALQERPDVRRVLASLPAELVRRIEPGPLSPTGIGELAAERERDPLELHRVTGGNPFFVTEMLAVPPGAGVPTSVREAVALRVAALPPDARAVVEVAAVVPGSTELWLLAQTVEPVPAAIEACLRAGILELHGEALTFRHDLARRAVAGGLGRLRSRELEAAVLGALEARGGVAPARLAHHARRSGDVGAVRRLAPAAARAASAAGSHRQALEHWEEALAAGAGAGAGEDVEALEGVAVEAYLCGRAERALEMRRRLLAVHEATGDALRAGESLRWLSRILWWSGHGAQAVEHGDRAIAVLEQLPEGKELAMALSGRSQLAMLAERSAEAIDLGTRAEVLARRIGDRPTLAHALTNVGTALLGGDEHERGRALLEEAFVLASADGEDDHAARALVNLATATMVRRRGDRRVAGDLERAIAFAAQRDLDGYLQYLLGARANLRVALGEWPGATVDAHDSLALGVHPGVSLCPALLALGRVQARRGEPPAAQTLDEAWRMAFKTGELQRMVPAAAGRAEHAWLDGDRAGVAAAARAPYALALERGDGWARGELAFWLWRAGELAEPPAGMAEPFALSIAGDWRAAAEAWDALGFPYESADARCDGDDEGALLDALATFDRLGASRCAAHLRRRLRAAGVRRVPRGPRRASQAEPAGLTPRQAEVLAQLRQGATNAEIARRLVIAPKTVDHHVSAVLAKLGVRTRREAAESAGGGGAGGGAQDGEAPRQDGERLPMSRGPDKP